MLLVCLTLSRPAWCLLSLLCGIAALTVERLTQVNTRARNGLQAREAVLSDLECMALQGSAAADRGLLWHAGGPAALFMAWVVHT